MADATRGSCIGKALVKPQCGLASRTETALLRHTGDDSGCGIDHLGAATVALLSRLPRATQSHRYIGPGHPALSESHHEPSCIGLDLVDLHLMLCDHLKVCGGVLVVLRRGLHAVKRS